MADSLDDFFAKKDKKRGKDKPKAVALSAEALVRELEEGSKQIDYQVRKDNKTSNVVELLGLDADDTDWRDFEDVEKRDYTGLKVKEMSLQDQADEEQRRLSEQIEPTPESTPWKTNTDQQQSSSTQPQSLDKASGTEATAGSEAAKSINTNKAAAGNSTNAGTSTVPSTSTTLTESSTTTTTSTPTTTATTKDEQGDNKPSASKYIPPHARMMSNDVKILEPSRLGKSKNTNSRNEPIPDVQDEKLFPSLG